MTEPAADPGPSDAAADPGPSDAATDPGPSDAATDPGPSDAAADPGAPDPAAGAEAQEPDTSSGATDGSTGTGGTLDPAAHLEQVLAAGELLQGVGRLVVGCSGGGDSTVLLDLLAGAAEGHGLELAVAHLDHGWRGAESAADARLVEELARRAGLPFFIDRAPAGPDTGSREAVARAQRLAFFGRVVREWPGDAVALGHTADDRAETLLLNLARGSGRRGLGAMRPRRRVEGVLLVRPLLDMRRHRLREHAARRGLAWREDSSNRDPSLTRNRLRRTLVPALEEIHPGAVENLARTARLLAAEDDWLDERAAVALRELRRDEPCAGAVAVDLEGLRARPRVLGRRILLLALAEVRGGRRGLSLAHVDAVLHAVVGGLEAARDLPGVRARAEGAVLRLLPLEGRRLAGAGGAGAAS